MNANTKPIETNAPRYPTRKTTSTSSSQKIINSPLIIVKFWSDWDKTQFLKQYFKFGNLNLTSIGLTTNGRIFVSDNLTPLNYKIYREAGVLKQAGKIANVMTYDGRIFIRKSVGDKSIAINNIDELNKHINIATSN